RKIDGGYTANDLVSMYQLRIENVERDDIQFLLDMTLANMKVGERRSDIYRHFEDLEERLFEKGTPEYSFNIFTSETRDYYNRLLAAVKAMLEHALHVADLTGASIDENDPEQMADVLI